MAPRRATGSAFAATRYESEPSPWPSAVEISSIQGACDDAVHAHSRAALTVIAPTPPDALNDNGFPVTVVSHLPDELGLVTFVDVELPHAATRRSANPAINARPRRFTAVADAGRPPLQLGQRT